MVWRRMFHPDETPAQHDAPDEQPEAEPQRAVPPHLARHINVQPRRTGSAVDLRRRLARLHAQREHTAYDIAQGELALADDNPWKQRIALLAETLETVEQDRQRAERAEPSPYWPVPPTPITGSAVEIDNDVATVRFVVGTERFTYEEPLDWAERGHQIARTELHHVVGDPALVMPNDVPDDLRDALRQHLDHALFVFATVLRDIQLDEQPLPDRATLADLARPCPVCGHWMDSRDRCQACARRKMQLQELLQERGRLLNARAAEIEEQHRMAERLPLARRRLRDIESEIATLEAKVDAADPHEGQHASQ